jgi:uncharacterized protein
MSSTTHLLYLHGFRSSPQSVKARKMANWIRQEFPQVLWWCPQLPASPRQAMADLLAGVADWPHEHMAVVGSSLGGFYASGLAQQLGCPALLINPAVYPSRDLAQYIGQQTAWHDPSQSFYFEPAYVEELQALEAQPRSAQPSTLALIAKGDELLDWREMLARHQAGRVHLIEGSDHALSDFDLYKDEILQFLRLL